VLIRIGTILGKGGIRERGQVIVMFALLLPVLMGLGSIVLSVGNWYVHKKRLQTIVDAGAFAGGTAFSACAQSPITTNAAIAQKALEYAGDTARDPGTRNLQTQEPNDVRVVLNSSEYWAQANGTTPNSPSPGYGLDYTLPHVDGAGNATTDSLPCSVKFLDVKGTDDEAPLLWRWLPLHPSPKAKARVEIHQILGENGMLPWAVPEVDPKVVAALIVNEDKAATDPTSVIRAVPLVKQSLPVNDPLSAWNVWRADTTNLPLSGTSNFGVVILISRDPNASVSGSLSAVCNQNLVQTRCRAGATSTSGLSHIRAYSDSASPVAPRTFELAGGCGTDLSAPYFNLNGGCPMTVARAVVDFGVTGDPRIMPTCGRVSISPGGDLDWVDDGTPLGYWAGGSFTPGPGRNDVTMRAEIKRPNGNNCSQRTAAFSGEEVAAPYVADDASGPVEYLRIDNLDDQTLANSINKSPPGRNLRISVGLTPPLEVTDQWNDPPFYLRITTNSSQTQAVDCDSNTVVGPAGSHSNFRNEIEDGCFTFYTPNVRNGDCSNYGNGSLPPPTTRSNPLDDCVITQTGVSAGQIRQALTARFGGNPCKTLNHWPQASTDPYPDPLLDPRYVVLFVVDESSFQGSGQAIYPIRTFGGFYITGGDGLNCPGDDPPPPGGRAASAWGHFMTYVTPDPNNDPSPELCDFEAIGTCTAVLVE
jgi:Flp pilus assembly protein TadG